MRFRLLGPVQVLVGGQAVEIGPAKQRCVLAALLWSAGQPVPVDTLIDRVWGEEPPDQVHNALYSYIARLRDILRRASGRTDLSITKSSQGYLLGVPPEHVDQVQYQRWVRAARAEASAPAAAERFHAAIQLWRDVPLAGVPGDWAARARVALEEQHFGVLTEWAQAEVTAGRPAAVIDTLLAARQSYPFAEPLVHQLMIALTRTGRCDAALTLFRDFRATLAAERGLDPSGALVELEAQILRGELSAEPTSRMVPRQLPPESTHFTGRVSELESLDRPGSPIAVIAGAGGVGKTSLAVRWARSASERFPDGQFYVNLNGYGLGEPVSPATALDGFLRGLGLTGTAIPPHLPERTAMFRSLLAGRKALVLLDNAQSAEQVRPLLPGCADAQVLVTSRDGLAGLVAREGARRITLGVMSEDEAMRLLRSLLGPDRVQADPGSARRLVELCDRLPLAIRVAAERAAREPSSTLGELVQRLTDHANRLDLLDASGDPESAVRAVLSWSYTALGPEAARLLRLMGRHSCPALGAEAVACLIDRPVPEASVLLDRLVSLHLVERDADGCYRMHDLTRVYASELADAPEASGLDRLIGWYIHACYRASVVLSPESAPPLQPLPQGACLPEPADTDAALAWFERELPNVVALARDSQSTGRHHLTWQVVRNLFNFCHRRKRWDEWAEAYRLGLSGARASGNHIATFSMLNGLGVIAKQRGQLDDAMSCYGQALEAARATGQERLIGTVLVNLGSLQVICGEYELAEKYLREALQSSYGHEPRFACIAFNNLACVLTELGDYAEAYAAFERSLAFAEQSGHEHQLAHSLCGLAEVALLDGRRAEALEFAQRAAAQAERTADPLKQANALDLVGACLAEADRAEAARYWQRAAQVCEPVQHPQTDEMRRWLKVVAEAGDEELPALIAEHRQRIRRSP